MRNERDNQKSLLIKSTRNSSMFLLLCKYHKIECNLHCLSYIVYCSNNISYLVTYGKVKYLNYRLRLDPFFLNMQLTAGGRHVLNAFIDINHN